MDRSWRIWLESYACNSSKGCVFQVDHKYPKELPELHNGYLGNH